jgi:hypothetical protein
VTENEKRQRPVRKLTVKNFSVIKEAELEFGKITVLIGPQASGKSLLCKLAYFLQYEVVIAAVDAIKVGLSWKDFETLIAIRFSQWFHFESWKFDTFLINVQLNRYSVILKRTTENEKQLLTLETSSEFKEFYLQLVQPSSSQQLNLRAEERFVAALNGFISLQSSNELISPIYIPAGRAFFTNNLGSAVMQNPLLDPLVRRFNAEIVWNPSNWMPGLLASSRQEFYAISTLMDKIAGGAVIVQGNEPAFKPFNREPLPFSALSSGTQELLPLFNLLNRLVYLYESSYLALRAKNAPKGFDQRPWVYVEEPEVHIFPKTQYEVVQLFSWLANDPILNFSWVITTHSPYILSAFNNLIFAGQLGQDEKLKKKIKIDEKYWIEPGSFKAYSVHDGKTESILSESGLINGEYLDSVSETIAGEFDQLLRLEYGKQKAS